MRITVIQTGARRGYLVPAIFARAGMLTEVYTDMHSDHAWLRFAAGALPRRAMPRSFRRMIGRRLPPTLQPSAIRDRPLETVARHLAAKVRPGWGPEAMTYRLAADLERSGIGPGDTVYTMMPFQDVDTVQRLRDRGVRVIHDAYSSPLYARIVQREHELYPGIEPPPDKAAVEAAVERMSRKYQVVDSVFAISQHVADSVAAVGARPAIVHEVSPGLDLPEIPETPGEHVPGRVISAGRVSIAKGSHHFAHAARALQAHGTEFIALGAASADVRNHPLMQGPRYVGAVPRAEMSLEYRKADVLVFPTLSDGFGLVLVEALAHGVPVVASPFCGSVVRDGVEGFVVDPHDREALVSRIRQIVEDRDLRQRMSENARIRARDFSVSAYEKRLIETVRSLP